MFTDEEHFDNLTRHIEMVIRNGVFLGKRLLHCGRADLAAELIARVYCHDNSKFYGEEAKYLHRGPDTPREELDHAIFVHVHDNDHHPEAWKDIGGVHGMSEAAIAEMVCDWGARAQEGGRDLRGWVAKVAVDKYKIGIDSTAYKRIMVYLDLLLESSFVSK